MTPRPAAALLRAPGAPVPEPPGLPDPAGLMARAGGENFPVASRLLPRARREELLALYGFARLVDDVGDGYDGDRLAALDWLEADLGRALEGRASHPLMRRVGETVRRTGMPDEPLRRLIEANRVDQRVYRYADWDALMAYCHLSADPVGELVLHLFGAGTPVRVALSDRVCSALQVIEHLGDVAEDHRAGRVYLPADSLARFGVAESDLAVCPAPAPVRALVAHEAGRARELLSSGPALVRALRGRPRLAVAAFVGGGRAALGALAAAGHDISRGAPRAGHLARAAHTLAVLAEARR